MNWILLNVFLCFFLVLLLWVRKRKNRFRIFKDHGIPGPDPNFWIGNFNDFITKREACLPEYFEKYGNIFGCFLGAKPFLVAVDPDLIKMIQVKDFKLFANRDILLPNSGYPSSDILHALPLAKDKEWKRLRTILSPSFSTSKLKKISPSMNDAITVFWDKIAEKSKRNESFDISFMYRDLFMDIIVKTEFGFHTRIQHGEKNLFFESATLVAKTDFVDILSAISICFPETEPIPTILRFLKDKFRCILGLKSFNTLLYLTQDLINRKRELKERHEDILQSLIDAKVDVAKLSSIKESDLIATGDYQCKEQIQEIDASEKTEYFSLSDEAIRANAAVFLLAGYDTTNATIGFVTYYLVKHQDIQEKVREEIKANIKTEASVEYGDVFKLPYLDQVISETLRLHPISMIVTNRIASKTFKHNGLVIPKGMTIGIPPNLLHRQPDHWPDPDKFNPDRFSPVNKAKIDPIMYQPFGNGPRNCIGMRFAQLMMKLTLVRVLRSYTLEKANEGELEIEFNIGISRPKEVVVRAIPI